MVHEGTLSARAIRMRAPDPLGSRYSLHYETSMQADLSLEETDTADDPVFDGFFEAYERAFVLPDEMEDRGGFATCLALNHGEAKARLASEYGDYRELCLLARDTAGGAIVGGANFIALPHPDATGSPLVSANLNYIFVVESARGKGMFRALYQAVERRIATLFGNEPARVLVFIEQNDPLLLAPEDYARDTALTGLDQIDRLRIWSRVGAKLVDFAYVQPALSAAQAADDRLAYSVLGATEPSLPAAILARHLRLFFGISVLKGQPLNISREASAQLERLDALSAEGREIALLDLSDRLDDLATARSAGLNGIPLRTWLTAQPGPMP